MHKTTQINSDFFVIHFLSSLTLVIVESLKLGDYPPAVK